MGQPLLNQYAALEQEAKAIQKRLESLNNDPRLQIELEFKDKLVTLMEKFDKSPGDVLTLLRPDTRAPSATTATGRAKRKLKVFKNPNTGEIVETRGGNQKTLKAWKGEYGDEAVESWVIEIKD